MEIEKCGETANYLKQFQLAEQKDKKSEKKKMESSFTYLNTTIYFGSILEFQLGALYLLGNSSAT
jgi:hypothetical protein